MEGDCLAWSSWPLRDRWPLSLSAPASILGVVLVVHLSFGLALFDVIAFVALSLSLLRYLLPTQVRADAEGLTIRFCGGVRRHAWRDFAGCEVHPRGLVLRPRPPPLSEAAEVVVPVPPGRDDVTRYVRTKLG